MDCLDKIRQQQLYISLQQMLSPTMYSFLYLPSTLSSSCIQLLSLSQVFLFLFPCVNGMSLVGGLVFFLSSFGFVVVVEMATPSLIAFENGGRVGHVTQQIPQGTVVSGCLFSLAVVVSRRL